MESNLIVLFEFLEINDRIGINAEKYYRLVAPDQLTPEELQDYRQRAP